MLINAIKSGFRQGLNCCWILIRIIVPVYICITFIKYTPLMDWIVKLFSPVMGLFHLPGEAAIPWITGMFSDEYGAIAAIKAVGLTGFEITIVSMMVMFAHALFIEAAIIKKLDVSAMFFICYRMVTAVIIGIIFGLAGGLLT